MCLHPVFLILLAIFTVKAEGREIIKRCSLPLLILTFIPFQHIIDELRTVFYLQPLPLKRLTEGLKAAKTPKDNDLYKLFTNVLCIHPPKVYISVPWFYQHHPLFV